MERLRVGIVGSGGMARHHAEALSKRSDAALAGIASRNEATGRALAKAHGTDFVSDWRALDIDALIVATHNDSHGGIVLDALERGKHVLCEYPLARRVEEGERIAELAASSGCVLRMTHPEVVSNGHAGLRRVVSELGALSLAEFQRITPGRGARPEILLNLPVSGPPAHFFIYHIYPFVDLFGPAAWVEASAQYEGLRDDGRYDGFVNLVTVRFKRGGFGRWSWAGGAAIYAAEERARCVLTGGTLMGSGGAWRHSDRSGERAVEPLDRPHRSHHDLWLDEIARGDTASAAEDARIALAAIRISLGAERSMNEERRIPLDAGESDR